MTETTKQICDRCLGEFPIEQRGHRWFVAGIGRETDEFIDFCESCWKKIGASEISKSAYSLQCAVCRTSGRLYNGRTHSFKRVKPGVFVCYNGDCYGVWAARNFGKPIKSEVRKIKATGPVLWKPRPISW